MKTVLFILLPVLAWGQTYKIEMVQMDGSFYDASGFWQYEDETIVLQSAGVTTVFSLNEVIKIDEGKAWRAASGSKSYIVALQDLKGEDVRGMTLLIVNNVNNGINKAYIGRISKY